MPELTVHRKNAAPAPMICMYCGEPATSTEKWREENRKPVRGGGGTDITPVPTGDDPVSAVFGVLMLPFVLWQLLVALLSGIGAIVGWVNRPTAPPQTRATQPTPAPTTDLPHEKWTRS